MIKLLLVSLAVAAATVEGRYFQGNLIRTPANDRIYEPSRRGRIVNGEPADIADFPHMLAMLDLSMGG
jgi:hypothetical protein